MLSSRGCWPSKLSMAQCTQHAQQHALQDQEDLLFVEAGRGADLAAELSGALQVRIGVVRPDLACLWGRHPLA